MYIKAINRSKELQPKSKSFIDVMNFLGVQLLVGFVARIFGHFVITCLTYALLPNFEVIFAETTLVNSKQYVGSKAHQVGTHTCCTTKNIEVRNSNSSRKHGTRHFNIKMTVP